MLKKSPTFISQRDSDAASVLLGQYDGGQYGGDAGQADWFSRPMEFADDARHLRNDGGIGAHAERAEIFGHAEAAGKDDGVRVVRRQLCQVLDPSASDTTRLDQGVPLSRGGFAGHVVDLVMLVGVGRVEEDAFAGARQGRANRCAFMNLEYIDIICLKYVCT
jgi:hypothetical protein